jgi:hypothetical protein
MQDPNGLFSPVRIQTVTRDCVLPATCRVNVKFSPLAAGEMRVKLSAVNKRNRMKCVGHEMKEVSNGQGDRSYDK